MSVAFKPPTNNVFASLVGGFNSEGKTLCSVPCPCPSLESPCRSMFLNPSLGAVSRCLPHPVGDYVMVILIIMRVNVVVVVFVFVVAIFTQITTTSSRNISR